MKVVVVLVMILMLIVFGSDGYDKMDAVSYFIDDYGGVDSADVYDDVTDAAGWMMQTLTLLMVLKMKWRWWHC